MRARSRFSQPSIFVPGGRAPFGQHQESRLLNRSSEIPVLIGFANKIVWDWNQLDLSDLTLSMRRVTGSPWIADFRSWTRPEVAILGADQNERGLWGRGWQPSCNKRVIVWKLEQLSIYTYCDIWKPLSNWTYKFKRISNDIFINCKDTTIIHNPP